MRSRLSAFTAKAAFLAALLLCAPAQAQNYTCPTAPLGTNNNRCASTAFVQGTVSAGLPITVGTSQVLNGTSSRVLYDNAGVLGEYAITGTGSVVLGTSPTIGTPAISSPTLSGTVAGDNTIPLSILVQGAANTMPGNWTGSLANVIANTMPSCADSGGNHLNYVNGTGITCGTGIGSGITALTGDVTATGPGSVAATLTTAQPGAHTWAAGQTFSSAITYGGVSLANSVTGTGSMVLGTSPTIASPTVTGAFTATGLVTNADLAGSIAASKLVGTDIATVGTLTAGTASTGFTVQASNVTWTGAVPGVNVATVADASGSPSATFGVVKCDGTTISCTSGTIAAVGVVASSIVVGTTTVGSGTTAFILYNNAGVLGNRAANTIPFTTGTLSLAGNLATTGAFSSTFAIGGAVTYTFPSSAATLASLNLVDQSLTGGATVTPFSIGSVSSGTTTIDCGNSPLQWMVNTGASTIAVPANDSSCAVTVINGSGAGAITLSNFSGKSPGGPAFATTATSTATVTFTNASSSIGWTAHALAINAAVYFTTTGALPTNFVAGTIYYVKTKPDANTITVSATPGGTAITAGSAGSGTQTGTQPSVYDLSITRTNGITLGIWAQVQ